MLCEGSYLKAVANCKSDDNGDILSAVRSHYYCRPAHQQLSASLFLVFVGVFSLQIWPHDQGIVSRSMYRSKRFQSILNSKMRSSKYSDLAIQARLFTSRLCWYFLPQHGRTWRQYLIIVVLYLVGH